MIYLGESDTDEPNGLEVSVNVENKDTSEFHKKAVDVYQWFDYKPETNIKLDYPEVKKIVEGANWYIEETKYGHRYNNVPLLIMGNVAYTLRSSDIPGLSSAGKSLLYNSIRITAPIGAVSITPGRESLSMDKHTIKYVKTVVEQIISEVSDKVLLEVKAIKNPYKRVISLNKKLLNLPTGISKINIPSNLIPPGFETNNAWGNSAISIKRYTTHPHVSVALFEQHRANASNDWSTMSLTRKELVFMVADTSTGYNRAVKEYKDLEASSGKLVILLKPSSNTKEGFKAFKKSVADVLKYYGDPEYEYTSKYMPDVIRKSKGKTEYNRKVDFIYKDIGFNSAFHDTRIMLGSLISSLPEETKIIYVPIVGHQLSDTSYTGLITVFKAAIKFHKYSKYKLIGVSKKDIKLAESDSRFTLLSDEVVKEVCRTAEVYTVGCSYATYAQFSKFVQHKLGKVLPETHKIKKVLKDTKVLVDKISDYRYASSSYTEAMKILKTSDYSKYIKYKGITDDKSTLNYVVEHYPLLNEFAKGYYVSGDLAKALKEYIDLIDDKDKREEERDEK